LYTDVTITNEAVVGTKASLIADLTGTATSSISAGLAISSTNAGLAVSSTSAGLAISSTNAGLAVSSTSAGLAISSTNAGLAVSSTNAGLAISSTNAGLAVSSTNAGLAVSSNNTANTNIVGSASDTIYLTGSRSSSSIANTAVYVLSGVSATGNTISATTFSGNATSSTSAGLAISSTNAGLAVSSTNAGLAVSSTNAGLAVSSTSAGLAISSTNAGLAISSTNAGLAVSSNNSANTNIVGSASDTIYLTGSRSSSSIANTAVYVLSGVSATGNTISATTFSGNATSSTSAGLAISSTNAGLAVSSTNAGLAVSSTSAGLAVSSTSAGLAISSTNAGLAVSSTSAGLAISSTNAGLAVSSTNAGLSQRVNLTTGVGSGVSFLVFSDVFNGTASLGATSFIRINASAGSIGATSFTGNWAGNAVTALYGGTGLITASKLDVLTGAASGSSWIAIGSTFLPSAYIGENAPAALAAFGATQPGQLWWDSTYGVLKVYYSDINTNQWVDALPVLGSNGGSAVKRSYLLSFGAGFTPSLGSDSVSILVPFAPDNSVSYYYIKRLELRNESLSSGAGVSFYIERNTTRNPSTAWTTANTIFSAAGSSFKAAGIYITSYTNSGSGASFVSSAGVAASIMSGDYLRLNFTALNGAATLAVSLMIEEQ
jgi:hypothetical protein